MIVTIDEQHRLAVPGDVCETVAGEKFDAFFDENQAAIVFRRAGQQEDVLDVMGACPVDMSDMPVRSSELPNLVASSCYDMARDLAGSLKGLPKDLAVNPTHMKGFGKSRKRNCLKP